MSPLVFEGSGVSGSAINAGSVVLGAADFAGTETGTMTGFPTLTRLSVQITANNVGAFSGSPLGGATATVFGEAIVLGLGGNPLLTFAVKADVIDVQVPDEHLVQVVVWDLLG